MSDEKATAFAALVDWLEGRLTPARAAEVEAAVAGSGEEVQKRVRWLRSFLTVAEQAKQETVPPIVAQRLTDEFAAWAAQRTQVRDQPAGAYDFLESTAELMYDSRSDRGMAGVRSAAQDDTDIHLAYSSDLADLLIDVEPGIGDRLTIRGQVLPTDPRTLPVFGAEVLAGTRRYRTVDGEAGGTFTVANIPVTATELRVSNGQMAIVAPLQLGR